MALFTLLIESIPEAVFISIPFGISDKAISPPNIWYKASIECVLPPPKEVLSWITGSPPFPFIRFVAATNNSSIPFVT